VDALFEFCVDKTSAVEKEPETTFAEPPTKYRGKLVATEEVRREWQANLEAMARDCG
jgi:hypothetical protein